MFLPSPRVMTLVSALCLAGLLATAGPAAAQPIKSLAGVATGQIVSQFPCSATEICQEAHVEGRATHLGSLTGILFERVDPSTGTYTGTAILTTASGDTIFTTYTGTVTPPDSVGGVSFVEDHQIVGGTGRYGQAGGQFQVAGVADAFGHVSIIAVGTLSR